MLLMKKACACATKTQIYNLHFQDSSKKTGWKVAERKQSVSIEAHPVEMLLIKTAPVREQDVFVSVPDTTVSRRGGEEFNLDWRYGHYAQQIGIY